jgi:hypothetical protein
MRTLRQLRVAFLAGGAALVAGCAGNGGFAPPASPPAASPTAATPAARHRARASWTADGLGPQNLLYVSNGNGLVNIYRYWQRNLVGVLTDLTTPMGMCVDHAQNVYITDYGTEKILEYAHGGTKPIKTLDDSPYLPYGCAVSATGDLAVANYEIDQYSYNGNTGNIAVYKKGAGNPKFYGQDLGRFTSLAYDDHGDLLATDQRYYYYSFFDQIEFQYLPRKSKTLLSIALPNPNTSSGWPNVQGIAYDGSYWVVASYDNLYRYTINIKAELFDTLQLSGAYGYPQGIALYRKSPKAQAIQVVAGGEGSGSKNFVAFWSYPTLGAPVHQLTANLDDPVAEAISLRTR